MGKLIFLGSGNPEGIPVAFCACNVCQNGNMHRLRSSVLIKWEEKHFLIDTGPDFRQQMLQHSVKHLDGVFLTHPHYDHIGGIDDLRAWYVIYQKSLPVVLSTFTHTYLGKTREHLVLPPNQEATLPASLQFTCLKEKYGQGEFLGLSYTYVTYYQKSCQVTGYRFGDLAYLTDMNCYDEEIFDYLRGVKTLIMSASCTKQPSVFWGRGYSHFPLNQVEEFASRVGASQLIITHISHDLQKELEGCSDKLCAYDGMEVSWTL